MLKRHRVFIVILTIVCLMTGIGLVHAEGDEQPSDEPLPTLDSIHMTNGTISLTFTPSLTGLSMDDFLVTTWLSGTLVTLQDLAFDSDANTFTFTPVPLKDMYQELDVLIEPNPDSPKFTLIQSGAYVIIPEPERTAAPEASQPSGTAVNYGTPILLSCSTEGAEIYYTFSTYAFAFPDILYNENNPPVINGDATLKVIARKEYMIADNIGLQWDSDIVEFTYTLKDKANVPAASIRGAVDAGTAVTLSCSTPGAEIRYTLDGTEPTESSTLYTRPITISKAMTIKAIAVKSGITNSNVAAFSYTIKQRVATPTVLPSSGIILYGSCFYISCSTPEVECYYTTDGSDPTDRSNPNRKYAAWLGTSITVKSNITVRAYAARYGMTNSSIATRTYTCKASMPRAYALGNDIYIRNDVQGGITYYTTDGSDPSDVSNPGRMVYSEASRPVVNAPSTTIKAYTVKEGILDSDVAQFTFIRKVITLSYCYHNKNKVEGFTYADNYDYLPLFPEEGVGIDIAGITSAPQTANFGDLKVWYSVSDPLKGEIKELTLESSKEPENTILLDVKTNEKQPEEDAVITIYVEDLFHVTSSIDYKITKKGKLEPVEQ